MPNHKILLCQLFGLDNALLSVGGRLGSLLDGMPVNFRFPQIHPVYWELILKL